MYIPTIFFGGTESCVNLIPSQSTFPTGSTQFGQIGPTGSDAGTTDSYFFVRCEPGEEVNFVIQDGITTTAKLLLIGGGGGVTASYTGGGAAGDVIFQDISLEPGNYLLSSSAYAGNGELLAGNSVLFTNVDDIPSNQTKYIAYGGGENRDNGDGGNNTNYVGGDGTLNNGGGGGAGSSGNGGDRDGDNGGNGGPGTTIPSPFNAVVGITPALTSASVIAGGGYGAGQCGDQDGLPGSGDQEYGHGANYDFTPSCVSSNHTGIIGAAFLFVPIKDCSLVPSGAIILPTVEDFTADGGDIIGTFTSGSDTFQYHIFTTDNDGSTQDGIFSVKSGSITDAKILCVGGGGGAAKTSDIYGGSGAGQVAIKRNSTLYGMYDVRPGRGGVVEEKGIGSYIQPISSFVTYVGAEGGGVGTNPTVAGGLADGGSGGGGFRSDFTSTTLNPGIALSGSLLGDYNTADIYYGSPGGIATAGTPAGVSAGGGGGALTAGQTGSNFGGFGGDGIEMTGEFFPTNIWVTGSIARGGDAKNFNTTTPSHTLQSGSGDGGHYGQKGSDGFVCITYKI
tara:strand:+ start:457 stop:2145 length:1689 start_codon:yes stop_codon:yes gene_type:complete